MRLVLLIRLASVFGIGRHRHAVGRATPSCRVVGGLSRLQELPEASGLAASRRTPRGALVAQRLRRACGVSALPLPGP